MTPTKPSLWKYGGLTKTELGKRVFRQIKEDEVAVRSASLAYYFMLAVFPAMLVVLSIIGFFGPGSQLQQALFSNLARMLPGSTSELIQKTLQEVTHASSAGKAVIGALGALWAASNGTTAIMQSLNVAYEVREDRPWWKQKVIALGLTLALATLVLSALGLTLFGGRAADFLGSHGFGTAIVVFWKKVQWPLVVVFMFVAFATTYYFAPNLKKPEWNWITPGSALGALFWIVASLGFKLYLHFFNSYSKTYGSLGAVITLLLWLYITGFCILLGGEINSEIGRAAEDMQERERQRQNKIEQDIRTLWGQNERRGA